LSSTARAACTPTAQAAIDAAELRHRAELGSTVSLDSELGESNACIRHLQHGSIAHVDGRTSTIFGEIHRKWMSAGGPSGIGLPVTDALPTPDGVGRFAHFERGSIYWRPCLGAYMVYGLIRDVWAQQRWERGPLGYPKTDELPTFDGVGRYSEFQGGYVLYHPSLGTFALSGAFRRVWEDKGGLGGLGYPTSALTCTTASCSQSFERGQLNSSQPEFRFDVDLRGAIVRKGMSVRHQEGRGTCSVFTTTFLLEYAYTELCDRWTADFSEEYLNHVTNLATGDVNDGDFFHNIIRGYETYGIVTESTLPYRPEGYSFDGYYLPPDAVSAGNFMISSNQKMRAVFIRPWDGTEGLTSVQMQDILAALRRGTPVGVGRSHSMPVVGFRLDANEPGGGVFLFQNSWGTGWGDQGYHYESFADVQAAASDAFYFARPAN
jgi:hypothetical protein